MRTGKGSSLRNFIAAGAALVALTAYSTGIGSDFDISMFPPLEYQEPPAMEYTPAPLPDKAPPPMERIPDPPKYQGAKIYDWLRGMLRL